MSFPGLNCMSAKANSTSGLQTGAQSISFLYAGRSIAGLG